MVSSRDGAAKGLNGFDPNVIGEGAKAPDSPPPQLAGLVDELAQALGVARDNLSDRRGGDERRTIGPAVDPIPVITSHPAPAPAPAAAPTPGGLPVAIGRHLFDDEEDDAHMPIPSTWRAPPEPPKPTGTFNDQLRAAGLGFATGLALVVPAVLLLTGKLGDLPFTSALYGTQQPAKRASTSAAVTPSTSVPSTAPSSYSAPAPTYSASAPSPYSAAAPSPPAPAQSSAPALPGTVLQSPGPQRNVVTAAVAPTKVEPEPQLPPPVEAKPTPPPAPSWNEAIAEGKQRIQAGDIVGARDVLSKPATADNAEALLILGETYDPNMLAAWGARGASADVAIARSLYGRALAGGVEHARARLKALE